MVGDLLLDALDQPVAQAAGRHEQAAEAGTRGVAGELVEQGGQVLGDIAVTGQQAQILNQAGYAGTSAANADGWTTQTSTVFYEDPRMEGTAKDIAAKLGISNVRQESGLGDPDIVVILR